MNSIVSVNDLDSLDYNSLIMLDDENNGICLAMKSNELFNDVNFKFKKLKLKNNEYGILLLKLDNSFYSCYVGLFDKYERDSLKKLLSQDFFNLIIFNDSKCHKVYRINNKFENKLLMNLPIKHNSNLISDAKKAIAELKKIYTPEFLWNN